jgi:STE24 endopeptidase
VSALLGDESNLNVMDQKDHPVRDPARRERAREYAALRRRLFVLDLLLSGGALALLLATGGAAWLRDLVARASDWHPVQVALYAGVLTLASAVLFLPLSYYAGFVLPHRYELSVQRLSGWATDYLKGTLLGLVQGALVAVPVYALLRVAPDTWWLWAALVLAVFAVVLANLAPVLIVPLFYTLRPLEDERLRERLLALAAQSGTQVRGVYVMDMSRRTRAANAALMGIGNTRRVVLGDTLWERFEPEEIEGILAHELGHHVHGDLWRGMALQAALTFGALWVADRVLRAAASPFGLTGADDLAGLPLLLLVAGVLFTALMPLTNGVSRAMEAAADRFAVRATGDVTAWKGALRKLADQNLAEVDPPAWVEWLLYSHPSIRHRLEAADRATPGRENADTTSSRR